MAEEQVKPASGGPTMTLIFSMLSFFFAANLGGLFKPAAGLYIGLIQIGIWPTYLIAANSMLRDGDGLYGNTFLYFATFFGLVPGLTSVFSYFAALHAWPLDPMVLGIMWIYVGLLLLCTLPGFKSVNAVFFLVLLFAGLGVFLLGLGMVGLLPASFYTKACVFSFGFVGIFGFYLCVDGFLSSVGIELPKGHAFFKA
jgi:hypothetical protein